MVLAARILGDQAEVDGHKQTRSVMIKVASAAMAMSGTCKSNKQRLQVARGLQGLESFIQHLCLSRPCNQGRDRHPQHGLPAPSVWASWTEGRGTSLYEQKTQQSPSFGGSNAPLA
jgi:hypothetical protein